MDGAPTAASVAATPSDSASPSGGDSDADAHPRVHPTAESAAPPPPPALYGFACAFSHGRCGHDELFRPHYTRTNLRKGDKILRCFPHCCPDHVTRSFCGASLHLDVQWSSTGHSGAATRNPEVLVYARFRVQDARGRVPGDHVTRAEIAQSLQSEGNPHGEWIAAARVSSSSSSSGDGSTHEWVFELNHEARWYYHWESGVAKRHRLKHHVLDVFVLSPSFSNATVSSTDLHDDHRPLEVVAVTRSPPFRLISFRRATPKAVQALSVPRVPRVQREASGSSGASCAETAIGTTSATANKSRRPSATNQPARRRPQLATVEAAEAEEDEEKTAQVADVRVRPVHMPLPLPSQPQPRMQDQRVGDFPQHPQSQVPYPYPYPQHHQRHDHQRQHPLQRPHQPYATTPVPPVWRPETALSPHAPSPPHVAGRPSFADLTSFLHRDPHPTQPPLPPQPQPLLAPLPTQRSAAQAASQRLLRLLRCLRLVRSADTVPYMDTFQRIYAETLARASGRGPTAPSAPPFHTSVNAVHRLLADAGVLHAPRPTTTPPLPAAVTAILCELLLWLSFDVDLHRAVHAIVAREAAAVFSQPQLQTAFAGLVKWLERHVDAFLHDRGWRLEDIVRAVEVIAGAGLPIPQQDEDFASALRVCVAQFSEHCATQAKASAAAARQRRRQQGPRDIDAVARPQGAGYARRPSQWALNGDWTCEMLQGGVSVRSLGSTAPADLSLQTLFAILRELGAIRIRLDGDAQASTTLDATSLLNPGDSNGARLTLDQTGHWFRSFPSGVSTAALTPGDLRWGDHSGEAAWASEAVQCSLYAWDSGASSSLGRCFQLQLWTPTADALVVRIACSRAAVLVGNPPATAATPSVGDHHTPVGIGAVAQQLPLCSLSQKLRLVRAWEPTLEAELRYTRVHRRR